MQKYTDMMLLNCFGLHCAQYKGIKTNILYNLTIIPPTGMPVANSFNDLTGVGKVACGI